MSIHKKECHLINKYPIPTNVTNAWPLIGPLITWYLTSE